MKIACVVKPGSKVNTIFKGVDGQLIIRIKVPPINGKANEYLIKYLAKLFQVRKRDVEIISGFTSSYKRINIVADDSFLIKQIQNIPNQ